MRSWGAIFLMFFAICQLYATQQPDAQAIKKVRSLMDKGIELQHEDKHTEAIKKFDRAYKLLPHPKILFYKGKSLYALKKYEKALKLYETIIENEKVKKYKDVIKNIIHVCRKKLKKTEVVLKTPGIKGINVFIDNNFVGKTPLTVSLKQGKHALFLRKKGFEDLKEKIICKGEDRIVLEYKLQKVRSKTSKIKQNSGSVSVVNKKTR